MKNDNAAMKHKQFAFKAETVADDGTFKGYGSVFGNLDSYKEIVAPGAFADSLKAIKAGGDPLPALWQHRSGEPIGGYDVLEEDDKGLKVEGWLLKDQIPRAAEAHALMKRRVVRGLSIGYYVRGSSYDEKTGVLTLTKLDLREISIVTFPANELAQIDSVKTAQRILEEGGQLTTRQFEEFLRDSGFSKSVATELATRCAPVLTRRDSEGDTSGFLAALQTWKLPT